jgi:hypothetical protein
MHRVSVEFIEHATCYRMGIDLLVPAFPRLIPLKQGAKAQKTPAATGAIFSIVYIFGLHFLAVASQTPPDAFDKQEAPANCRGSRTAPAFPADVVS